MNPFAFEFSNYERRHTPKPTITDVPIPPSLQSKLRAIRSTVIRGVKVESIFRADGTVVVFVDDQHLATYHDEQTACIRVMAYISS